MKKELVLITGATGSIGRALTESLAEKGYDLVLAVRNTDRGKEIADTLARLSSNIRVEQLDLSQPESIIRFADKIAAQNLNLTGVINNAGIMDRDFRLSGFGIENTMGVNVIGTALLTRLLIPLMETGGKCVFTSSLTRRFYSSDKIQVAVLPDQFTQLGTYGRSKAAITLYASWLQTQFPQLIFNCADPGIVDSGMITMHRWFDPLADIFFRPLIRKPRKAAKAAVNALNLNEGCYVTTMRGKSRLDYINNESNRTLIESINSYIDPLLK